MYVLTSTYPNNIIIVIIVIIARFLRHIPIVHHVFEMFFGIKLRFVEKTEKKSKKIIIVFKKVNSVQYVSKNVFEIVLCYNIMF